MNQILLDQIIAYSRQKGFRLAKKRVAVAMALNQIDTDTDADSLWIFLRRQYPRISRGTVYLALQWLTNAGISQRTVRQDRTSIYRLARAACL
ncbi:transcriptional repressor [Spirosoma validum]|uniref:Transcriptional repressor n=1 Tax=Spirosoma validum TaxID=2771355 RepID=A0A927GCV2_9BACT|nr:transcriptional repressor [Spirosoma validum]MBD2753023.1 transcriptional repressor [Spirosoma validum]